MEMTNIPDDFERRVREAQAWFYSQDQAAFRASKWRTPELMPETWLKYGEPGYMGFDHPDTLHERQAIVDALVEKRASFLEQRGITLTNSATPLPGRLLYYIPDESILDDYSAELSEGYFDGDDVPSWDTWIMYVGPETEWGGRIGFNRYAAYINYHHALIAWVPPELVSLVDDGIAGNAVACIGWVRGDILLTTE